MEIWLIKNVNDTILIPINPQDIEMDFPMNHEDVVNTDGVERTVMSGIGLRSVSINSFFPRENTYYSEVSDVIEPRYYANKIEKWMREENNVITFKIVAERNITFQATVRNFVWRIVGGAVGDVEFTLDLKEYRPVTYKVVDLKATKEAEKKAKEDKKGFSVVTPVSNRPNNSIPKPKTHTVKKGDTLSKLAKKYYNDSSKHNKIYQANKKAIGKNPNLIKAGQVLVIP